MSKQKGKYDDWEVVEEAGPYDDYEVDQSPLSDALDYIGGAASGVYDMVVAPTIAGGVAAAQYPAIIANKFFGTGEDISDLGTQAFEEALSQTDSAAVNKAVGRTPSSIEQKGAEHVGNVGQFVTDVGRGMFGSAGPAGVTMGQRMYRQPEKSPLMSTIGDFVGPSILLGGATSLRGSRARAALAKEVETHKANLEAQKAASMDLDTRKSIDQALQELDNMTREAEANIRAREEGKFWGQPEETPLPPQRTNLQGVPAEGPQGVLDFPPQATSVEQIAQRRADPLQPDMFLEPYKAPPLDPMQQQMGGEIPYQKTSPLSIDQSTPFTPEQGLDFTQDPSMSYQGQMGHLMAEQDAMKGRQATVPQPPPTPERAVAPQQAEYQAQMIRKNQRGLEEVQQAMEAPRPAEPLDLDAGGGRIEPTMGKPEYRRSDFRMKTDREVGLHSTTNNLTGALDRIVKNPGHPTYAFIAQALKRQNLKDVGIEVNATAKTSSYDPGTNTITIAGKHAGVPEVVLHEAVHAAIHNLQLTGHPLAKKLQSLYRETFKKGVEIDRSGFKNEYEFVTEALTNPDFQEVLSNIKLSSAQVHKLNGAGRLKTMWDAVVDFVRQALGMPVKQFDVLSLALKDGTSLLAESTPESRASMMGKFFAEPPQMIDMIDPYGGKPAARGTPPEKKTITGEVVKSKTGEVLFDRRTAKELVDQTDWSKVDDMGDLLAGTKSFFQGYTIANLTRSNPLARWLVDNFHAIERKHLTEAADAKLGSTYRQGRITGVPQHVKDFTGATTYLHKYGNSPTGQRVFDVLKKLDDEARDLTDGDISHLNAAEKQAVQSIRKVLDERVRKHNELAAKAGFTKIQKLPGFLPHMRLGDHMVFVYDSKTAKTIRALPAKNAYEAKTIAKDLRKQFPDMKIRHTPRRSKFDINDVSAFNEALGLMQKGSPEYAAIDKAFQMVLAHRGFQKHTLHRKGTSGWLGENSPKDLAKALDLYIDRHSRFLASQEKNLRVKELYEALKEKGIDLRNDMPNMDEFVQMYRDHHVGAIQSQLEFLDNFFQSIGRRVGSVGIKGKSIGSEAMVGDAISELNGLASTLWLTTPKFLIGNLFQPLFNLSKMAKLGIQMDIDKAPMREFFTAYKNMVTKDAYTMDLLRYASENGYLDPRVADLMGMDAAAALKWYRGGQNVTRFGLQKFENSMVRGPSIVMYDAFLKDAVPNKETRWKMAGELANDYMVDYNKTERPMIYQQMGMIGEKGLAPLKTYAHAYFGNALEYLQSIRHEKSFKPMAYFLGTQVFMSGMKGIILAAEVNAIITAINFMAGTDIPLVEEFLIENDTGDAMTFGGISTLTGTDFSGSIGSPSIGGLVSAPGVEFGTNAVSKLGKLLLHWSQDKDTDADYMEALSVLSSPMWVAQVENWYTDPDTGLTPNPRNDMLPDVAPRDAQDWFSRMVMGGFSVNEAKQKMEIRQYKIDEQTARGKREVTMAAIVDRVENGVSPSSLVREYVKQGGDYQAITEQLMQRLMKRNLDYAQRELIKVPRAERLKRLEKFNLIQQDMSLEELGQLSASMKQGSRNESRR